MSDSPSLLGRAALVTGAGKRLGRAIALRLASEGADIAVHYNHSRAEAEDVASQIRALGRNAVTLQAELTSIPQLTSMVNSAAAQLGHLDILVNSAANFLQAKFGETSEAAYDASLDTNLKSPFFCAQAAAPHLKKSGRGVIINFTDLGGLSGWREFLPHSLSKAGIVLLTRTLAKELGPEVRVNALAPGTISMPGDPPEWEQDFIRLAPVHHSGRPRDIEDAILYLIHATFVTGHVLVLDGGRTL